MDGFQGELHLHGYAFSQCVVEWPARKIAGKKSGERDLKETYALRRGIDIDNDDY